MSALERQARSEQAARSSQAFLRPDRKVRPEHDGTSSSRDMSPISTHSRNSIDTTGMPDEEQGLLSQPDYPQYPQSSGRPTDPPPEYSPRAPDPGRLAPEQMPLNSSNSQSYYTFPHTAPATPGDAVINNGGDFFQTGHDKRKRRRGCCCCGGCSRGCDSWSRRQRLLFALMAFLLAIVFLYWIVGIFRDIGKVKSAIPWYTCESADVKRLEQFDFYDTDSFTLQEMLHNDFIWPGNLDGKVEITVKAPGQKSAVRVNVDMHSTYLTYLQHIRFEKQNDKLLIQADNPSNGHDPVNGNTPCTAVNIMISVDSSKISGTLDISVPRLSVEIATKLSLASEAFNIHTSGGNQIARLPSNALGFRPRNMDLGTVAGGLDVSLTLVDQLWLASTSGVIRSDITVVDEYPPLKHGSAHFHVNTAAGSVMTFFNPLPKNFQKAVYTQASTVSGLLQGNYVHSAETNLTSVSGSIDAQLLWYDKPTDQPSNIFTESAIGFVDLTLSEPPTLDDDVLGQRRLRSTHKSVSGGMRIHYPPSWTGTGEAHTVFGSVDIAGPEVTETWRKGKSMGIVKGSGESIIDIDTVSGICEVLIDGW